MNYKELSELVATPLSHTQVYRLLGNRCNIFLYKELEEMKNLWELFMTKSKKIMPAIILYEFKPHYGHWVCLIPISDKVIEFFDPIGMRVDEELKYVSKKFRNRSTYFPHLSWLIANSSINKIISNNTDLQRIASDVATCGRWCALRIITYLDYNWSLPFFIKCFDVSNKDKIVTLLTLE